MDDGLLARLTGIMIGRQCVDVAFAPDRAVVLSFPDWQLAVWTCWRVVDQEGVIAGKASMDNQPEKALDALREVICGQTVKAVALVNSLNDLRVDFENGTTLESFADSEKFENWQLGGGPGPENIFAGPGQSWCSF